MERLCAWRSELRLPKQHRGSIAALRKAVTGFDALGLAGLRCSRAGAGQPGIGAGARAEPLGRGAAYALGTLEELYQAEVWGEDNEAAFRRSQIAAEVALAARFMELTQP